MANKEIINSFLSSLCGGFDFFDNSIFINIIHLYLFLILFTLPFIIFMYFTSYGVLWALYCCIIFILVLALKIINFSLHKMYDKAQSTSFDVNCDASERIKANDKDKTSSQRDEEGIELQVLNSVDRVRAQIESFQASEEHRSDENSCDANSAVSTEFPEQLASTIVDVHRKNSSGSSDESEFYQIKSRFSEGAKSTSTQKPSNEYQNTSNSAEGGEESAKASGTDEVEIRSFKKSLSADLDSPDKKNLKLSSVKLIDSSNLRKSHKDREHNKLNQKRSVSNVHLQPSSSAKLQRQVSVDSDLVEIYGAFARRAGMNVPPGMNRFHHRFNQNYLHFPDVSREMYGQNSNSNSDLNLENSTDETSDSYITNSAFQLTGDRASDQNLVHSNKLSKHNMPMRRDSNSTMSALQLPTMSAVPSTSGCYLSSRKRRNSNNSNNNIVSSLSIRRIKSDALETNMIPNFQIGAHPNSIEVIDGLAVRNRTSSIIPPPSLTLSRNPPQKLYPNSFTANITSLEESNSDKTRTNNNNNNDEQSNEDSFEKCVKKSENSSVTNDVSDNIDAEDATSNDEDSGLDQEIIISSDFEDDNNRNGSRSPLLEQLKQKQEIIKAETSSNFEVEEEKLVEKDSEVSSASNTKPETETSEEKLNKSAENPAPQQSLGAIPKRHLKNQKHDMLVRKSSIGDEHYPISKVYQRKLSQRSTSERIPEDNVVQVIEPHLCRCADNSSNSQSDFPTHYPQQNSSFSGKISSQKSFSECCAMSSESSGIQCRRLRFARRSDLEIRFKQPEEFNALDGRTSARDYSLSFDETNVRNSSMISNRNRMIIASAGPSKSSSEKNDFNCFIDEHGRWINVVNDCKSHPLRQVSRAEESHLMHQQLQHLQIINNQNVSPYLRILTTAPSAEYSLSSVQSIDITQKSIFTDSHVETKYYKYSVSIFKKRWRKSFKIQMTRLQLLSLFDRDQHSYQITLAILLSTFVSILGSWVLFHNFYHDVFAFFFCFTIAGSQYSLLKSVQPDSASPIHGFNKIVTYSRAVYFCILTSLMLMFHYMSESLSTDDTDDSTDNITIYGIKILWRNLFANISVILQSTILFLPLLFCAGLFPQFNTFLMYLSEQIEMNIFGGNAVCNLSFAFLALLRSIFACIILTSLLYGGLIESSNNNTQHVLISMFVGLLVCIAYHLSRSSSDFTYHLQLVKSTLIDQNHNDEETAETENGLTKAESSPKKDVEKETSFFSSLEDPLPKKIKNTVQARLKNDLIICTLIGLFFFALHSSTIFKVLQPNLGIILHCIAITVGFFIHYLLPQLRKHLPFLCLSSPVLRSHEFGQFEVSQSTKVRWFELLYVYLSFFERNILFPLIFISAITADSITIVSKFGYKTGSLLITVASLKALRLAYSDISSQYLILLFSILFFNFDFANASETLILDYFIISILFRKVTDLLLKLQFVITYIAPWQITWGSAFHAFAQPFSVPHSAMLFLQTVFSSIFSTPLNPFLGSAIFITSYARPIKYWERDYNTLRIDNSNTRLISQLERDLGADDNNLNSIFYEHLTRSLQHSLCGDLLMGRWGNVSQGDCFVLASDYLNCLIHIIELGNGLCTFQMRGLEFRGTYCQQREVEAISEGVEDNDGCCCCSVGHFKNMLSINAMFSTRWLAWQVVAAQYILEGYSISDNAAVATLQVFEFRKVLISYYVKSIIYYVIKSPKLHQWLNSPEIQEALETTLDKQFVDLDPIFNHNLDDDYDFRVAGISRSSFWRVYSEWIQYCVGKVQQTADKTPNATASTSTTKRDDENAKSSTSNNEDVVQNIDSSKDSVLTSLCFSLALLARRTLATASHSASSLGVEFFLHGLHSLFKGDFRITSTRDEWVFIDMDLLHNIVAPAIKMSLKLHQDHFLSPEEYDDYNALFGSIETNTKNFVISHEADPLWRNSVLRGAPNLLALRHVMEDGSDEYRVIRLTKRYLNFRVIKLNRECVRGLWSGQQQELIFLRNRNPERGSIQNAKQALRNIINSSCDIPIGYPIYVSPLTTSYADTNEQLNDVIGGAITYEKIQFQSINTWKRIRKRFREGCSSGIEAEISNTGGSCYGNLQNLANSSNISQNIGSLTYGSQSMSISGRESSGIRGSLASINKPMSSTLLAGFLNRERSDESGLRDRVASGRKPPGGYASAVTANERLKKESSPKESSTNSASALVSESTKQSTTDSPSSARKRSIESNEEENQENLEKTSVCSKEEVNASDESLNNPDEGKLFQSQTVSMSKRVVITDKSQIYDCLDDQRIDVVQFGEKFHRIGLRSSWKNKHDFCEDGMIGVVVGCLSPVHASTSENQNILLVKIDDMCIAIAEKGVKEFRVLEKDPPQKEK